MRWINGICAGLLVLVALGFLISLPEAIVEYQREPEDVWVSVYWLVGLGLLVALCFANATRPSRPPRFGPLSLANMAAVIGLAPLFYVGRHDPAVAPLIALCILGPIVLLALAFAYRPVQRF